MKPIFFASPGEFREWLKEHHATETEVLVGFYKKATGKPTMSWSDAVDEALCYGWIDGHTKRIDDTRFRIRFTPRKPGSNWSKVNVAKAEALIRGRRMRAAGRKAYEARSAAKTGVYSFEQAEEPAFTPAQARRFKAQKKAWAFFQAQPPWYRRAATWWVISAKKEETRLKRLSQLIDDSKAGRTVPPLTR